MIAKSKLARTFLIATFLTAPATANAVGTGQGGRDVLHVPLSWCAVQGSPAAANPNILSVGAAAPDTTTDAVLWRRHERPTDNIYLPQSDITFRSAINDVWGTLNFPIIADPNTALGVQGDVRGEANTVLGAGSEFATVIQNCDDAWATLGRAGIGITAVNVNLFHDGTGNYVFVDAGGNITGGTPIGWAGCTRPLGSNVCSQPYDARVMVADNFYLYPTVPDRTLPPSPLDLMGNLQYGATDPLDQLFGHEAGHALGLDHAVATTDLMFGQQTDNSGDGQTDNITLDATEVGFLRQNAGIVPGLEIDPPNQIDPGNFVAMTIVDDDAGERDLPAHIDITSIKAVLDKAEGIVYLGTRVRGVTPRESRPALFFVGLDVVPGTGMRPADAEQLGLPRQMGEFGEIDVVVAAAVVGERAEGRGFVIRDGQMIALDEGFFVELQRLTMYPHYTPIEGQRLTIDRDIAVDIYDTIAIQIRAEDIGVQLGQPFTVVAASTIDRTTFDIFGGPREIILEDPSFPHCFAQEPGVPGGTAQMLVDGLLPSQPFHALVGPVEVYRGETDAEGNADFELPIPDDARPGLHLVTIGNDGTALTADCVVEVREREGGGGEPPPDRDHDGRDRDDHGPPGDDRGHHDGHGDDGRAGYFDVLDGYRHLLERLGLIVAPLIREGDVDLLREYLDLIIRYGAFLEELAPDKNSDNGEMMRWLPAN